MDTVRQCLDSNRQIYGDEKEKVRNFLSGTLDNKIMKYTELKDEINKIISNFAPREAATNLWNWVSTNFSYKTNGCPGLADVVYVITILNAAEGNKPRLEKFYGDEAFQGLGQLLGHAHITNKYFTPIEASAAILKLLQSGGRRMKHKSRRMHRSKNNKTYRRKYNKRFT